MNEDKIEVIQAILDDLKTYPVGWVDFMEICGKHLAKYKFSDADMALGTFARSFFENFNYFPEK